MTEIADPHQRVVVGFDGSEPARLALDWAAQYAARIGAVLEPVYAYGPPSGLVLTPGSLDHEIYWEAAQFLEEPVRRCSRTRVSKCGPLRFLTSAIRPNLRRILTPISGANWAYR